MYELIYDHMNHRRIKKVYAESEAEAIELFEIWADGLDEFVDLVEVREAK